MKKIIFTSSLFFATCILQAQTTVTTTGGTANYVTKFSGTATVVNSSIFDDGSKIGLFTAAPDQIFELLHSTPYVRLRDNNNTTDVNGTCVIEFGQESGGAWSRTSYIGDGFSGVRALGIVLENSTDFLISSNANPSANPGLFFENSNQYVGINTLTPGSELDVKGTLRLSGSTSGYVGFAPAAAAGSTTYTLPSADGSPGQFLQTNSGVLSWQTPTTSGTAWQLTGNSGTTDGTNFLGTTAAAGDKPLNFRVNNEKAGRIDNAGPTFLGYQAGNSNTATTNTGIGYKALYTNTSYGYNTAMGWEALYCNSTGNSNTAIGTQALMANTTGINNTAVGGGALIVNMTGNYNTGIGVLALAECYSGEYNVASGYQALYSNSSGWGNTADGYQSLFASTGYLNTAIGYTALSSNTTGYYNTALGYALLSNTTGHGNTAVGLSSLFGNITGNYNTALGYHADVSSDDLFGATAIGYNATTDSDDQIYIGTSANSQNVGGYDGWQQFSDKRFKENIIEDIPGLSFIIKLRPVTYTVNTVKLDEFMGIKQRMDTTKDVEAQDRYYQRLKEVSLERRTGFIAQEVDSLAQKIGYNFDGVHVPSDASTNNYTISYATFVVPLVKAVQEQQKIIDSLMQHQKTTDSLQTATINSLLIHQATTDSLLTILQNCCLQGALNKPMQDNGLQLQDYPETLLQVELVNNSQLILYQNEPNPFGDNTAIRYFIPENTKGNIFIVFYDMYGKEIKKTDVTTKGFGNINVNTENLASGIYSYSLIVNDKVIDTKKMMKNN